MILIEMVRALALNLATCARSRSRVSLGSCHRLGHRCCHYLVCRFRLSVVSCYLRFGKGSLLSRMSFAPMASVLLSIYKTLIFFPLQFTRVPYSQLQLVNSQCPPRWPTNDWRRHANPSKYRREAMGIRREAKCLWSVVKVIYIYSSTNFPMEAPRNSLDKDQISQDTTEGLPMFS